MLLGLGEEQARVPVVQMLQMVRHHAKKMEEETWNREAAPVMAHRPRPWPQA